MKMMDIKCYSELIKLQTFEERFKYLELKGNVGDFTFNGHRSLNQMIYTHPRWKRVRKKVILRDNGCDMGLEEFPISGNIYIHHINPITIEDIRRLSFCIFDPENLISVSFQTHNAIHYSDMEQAMPNKIIVRKPNDTIPWR